MKKKTEVCTYNIYWSLVQISRILKYDLSVFRNFKNHILNNYCIIEEKKNHIWRFTLYNINTEVRAHTNRTWRMLCARISNDLLFYQSVMNYPLACNTYTWCTYMYIVIRTHVCTNLHLFIRSSRISSRCDFYWAPSRLFWIRVYLYII